MTGNRQAVQTPATVTVEEVARHNTPTDFWVIIDGFVYNLTSFLDLHPGGRGVLLPYAGRDATEIFYSLHRAEHLKQYSDRLLVGRLPTTTASRPQFPAAAHISAVPYAEPSAWQHFKSPYYTAKHLQFRSAMRHFVQSELVPHGASYETSEKDPSPELFLKMGAFGMLACRMGPAVRQYLKEFQLPGNIAARSSTTFMN